MYSLHHLEALLGHSRVELEDLAKHAVRYYKPFPLKRKEHPFSRNTQPAKKRSIDNPINPLKAIQARIENRLLKGIILPEHLLGGVKGRSIKDNAIRHFDARYRYLVTIDIRNFFPSITPQRVLTVWRKLLNCSPSVAYLLTGLTICRGRLPQGAPLLANLVLSSFDEEIRAVCATNGISYSSWVDDLAFSGDFALRIVGPVIAVLAKGGFSLSHQKLRVMGPGDRKILNKLVLGRFVTVQKQYISRIRAGIHNLKCGRVAAIDVDDYVQSLEGSVNYLRLFDTTKAGKLQEQVSQLLGARIVQSNRTRDPGPASRCAENSS